MNERSHLRTQMMTSQCLSPTNISDSCNDNAEATLENRRPARHSLASVLFDRFDTCPYCGGKFCD